MVRGVGREHVQQQSVVTLSLNSVAPNQHLLNTVHTVLELSALFKDESIVFWPFGGHKNTFFNSTSCTKVAIKPKQ